MPSEVPSSIGARPGPVAGPELSSDTSDGTGRTGPPYQINTPAGPSTTSADAFSASRHAIEELKKDAPIWKREHYQDGSEWVGLGS